MELKAQALAGAAPGERPPTGWPSASTPAVGDLVKTMGMSGISRSRAGRLCEPWGAGFTPPGASPLPGRRRRRRPRPCP